MPIYEYACKACGHEAEIMHKISDPTPRKCPACGKLKLAKQMSATGFRLGGGGWYETDFKSGNKRNIVDKGVDKGADKAPAAEAAKPAGGDKPGGAAKAEPKAKDKPKDKPAAKAA